MRTWFQMKAAGNGSAEISIYGSIGASMWDDDAVNASAFAEQLKSLGDVSSITLHVNSPGGDVFDGVTIHNLLAQHPAKVTAKIDGLAASAASFIVMAADEIVMPENAFMLVHEASAMAWGPAETMLSMAADLERINNSMAAAYASRTGQSVEEVRALMAEDRLMTASEAKERGYADTIDEPVRMAASYSLRELPEDARWRFEEAIKAEAPVDEPGEAVEADEVVEIAGEVAADESTEAGNVIDFEAARREAKAEGESASYAHAAEIAELCAIAGFPAMAKDFIAKRASIDAVRTALVTARAEKDAAHDALQSAHAEAISNNQSVSGSKQWTDFFSKRNPGAR